MHVLGLIVVALLMASSVSAARSGSPLDGLSVAPDGRTSCGPALPPKFATQMDSEAASRVEAVQGTYENMPGFLGVLSDGSQVSLIVEAETVVDWEKRVAQTDLHVMASCVPSELVAAAKWSVLGSDYSGGGFSTVLYDVFTDSVVITTTLDPDSVREAINDRLPAGAEPFSNSDVNADSALRVESAAAGSVGRKTRSADTPPFFGGGRIELPDGGCSTGFYISSVSNGTVMVTAGHCGINGDAVLNGNLSRTLGNLEGRVFPDPDLAVIDGQQYAARSFSAINDTSSKAISNAVNPTTGVTYCQMGSVLQRVCSAYSSLNAQFCDAGGCTNGLAYTSQSCVSGGLVAGGDSGGGVFKEANGTLSARGIVIAGGNVGNLCVRYDHRLATVLARYNATVVTQ